MTRVEDLRRKVEEGDLSAIDEVVGLLEKGLVRVAEPAADGSWIVNDWVRRAILALFRVAPMEEIEVGPMKWFDKIPVRTDFVSSGVRVVPPAVVRRGAYVGRGAILMPSFVNIGAYVGPETMVDTWATVGSCAQIGARVHLSGGVGIGGVLEPPGAMPVIVEDDAFIGSRAILVEGLRVGREAVLAANVTLTASTPILDVRGSSIVETRGTVPPRAVVVPGVREREVQGGRIFTACAYIIGDRKDSTDRKTSLNDVLRTFSLSV